MTLIISLIGKRKVIQVADFRVTRKGDPPREAYKAVSVRSADARFCIGYTGVAEIEGRTTDHWLVAQVSSIFDSGIYDVPSLTWKLAERAEKAMLTLRYDGAHVDWDERKLILVMAGYHDAEDGPRTRPFLTTVSNVKFRGLDVPLRVSPRFTIRPETIGPGIPDNGMTGIVAGEWRAFLAEDDYGKAARKGLMQVLRQIRRIDLGEAPTGIATGERLAWVMREASRHPKYGPVIGRDFLSVVVHPGDVSEIMPVIYHPEQGSAVARVPHLVTPWYVIPAGEAAPGSPVLPEGAA